MLEPLYNARMKVRRAKAHINGLNRRISNFVKETDNYLSSANDDPNGEEIFYTVEVLPHIFDDWGVIVGDIANCLRSSLDYVMWDICDVPDRYLSEKEARIIAFPILDEPNNGTISGRLKFVPDNLKQSVWDMVDSFQPYRRADWPELYLLSILDHLANDSKHRIITPVVQQIRFLFDGRIISGETLDDQTFQVRVPRWMRDQNPSFEPQVIVDIILEIPFDGYMDIRAFSFISLTSIHDFIRGEVFPKFQDFLSDPIYSTEESE